MQGLRSEYVPSVIISRMPQPVKVGPRCPEDTPFKQQRLPAWQPILTPNWVIGTFLIVGCVFMPIGGAIYAASSSVQEIRIDYGDMPVCKTAKQAGTPTNTVQFVVSKDMKNPLVYYELSNFYQNHRRYVTSRSDGQLRAAEDATVFSDFVAATRKTDLMTCTPLVCSGNAGDNGCGTASAPVAANGRFNLVYYPCGLIARSMFNDTFSNLRLDSGGADIPLNTRNIAWPSDIEKKFLNPNRERLKPDGGSNPFGFIGKYCGAFGDVCSMQDAAHPNDDIALPACRKSGWCDTLIDPSNLNGPKFTTTILRQIAGVTAATGTCNPSVLPALRPEQIYNCWHRCATAA